MPAVRDRLVAQALRLLLEPHLAKAFTPASFAYRPSLGVHQAIDHLLELIRGDCPWVLEADIYQFFDSVAHRLLFRRLQQEAIDPRLLRLVRRSLTCGAQLGSRLFPTRRGLPQGSPLSPLLANYYLTPFDQAMLRLGYHLIRYADDLVICCTSHTQAEQALDDLYAELARLRLRPHPKKTRILDSRRQEFAFLGFRILPNAILPTQENIDRFRDAVRTCLDPNRQAPSLQYRLDYLNALVRSFGHFYARCHVQELFVQLDQWIGQLREQFLQQQGLDSSGSLPSSGRNLAHLPIISCQSDRLGEPSQSKVQQPETFSKPRGRQTVPGFSHSLPPLRSLQSILLCTPSSHTYPKTFFGYGGGQPPPFAPLPSAQTHLPSAREAPKNLSPHTAPTEASAKQSG
ncbi:MAG: reverse transcriptase domain-containing protein [Thermoguttaceae bacterium]|nr:reverse transcriptase domain-containing protein [Thermoguttaceae bacterium]